MIVTRINVFSDIIGAMNTMKLENLVYHLADKSLEGYNGGQWEFVETLCGARYMRFPFKGERTLSFQFNEAVAGFDAAGIALTLMTLSHFSFHLYEKEDPDLEAVKKAFYKLLEYADGHAQAGQIFAFID